jgi:uncharacterized SAM-binding protein YcdF (DUF218 family)
LDSMHAVGSDKPIGSLFRGNADVHWPGRLSSLSMSLRITFARVDIGHRKKVGVFYAALGAIGTVLGAELLHWSASRRGRSPSPQGESRGVVVLGYRSKRNGRVHPLQRWRIDIAHRSVGLAPDGIVVFTGGARIGMQSEGEAMRAHADTLGLALPQALLEDQSLTTWENVKFALPMVERCDTVMFASDPMHAARARRYAGTLRPDLGDRICSGVDYRFLERWWLKVPTALYEIRISSRDSFKGWRTRGPGRRGPQ